MAVIWSSVMSAGTLTRADSRGRLTLASTPSSFPSLRSTRLTQEAHVMPSISRSMTRLPAWSNNCSLLTAPFFSRSIGFLPFRCLRPPGAVVTQASLATTR